MGHLRIGSRLLVILALGFPWAGCASAPDGSVQDPEPGPVTHPARVTLTMRGVEPEALFGVIEKQTGITLTSAPGDLWQQGDWPRVSLTLKDVPPMEALAAAGEAVGVYLERGPSGSILIMDHEAPTVPASEYYRRRAVKGPVMLIGWATQFDDGPHAGVTVYVQPGVRPYSVGREPILTQVVDGEGRSLSARPRPANDPFGSTIYLPSAWGYGMGAALEVPAGPPVRHLRRIEGHYPVTLVTASKRVEVPNIDQRQNVIVRLPHHELVIEEMSIDPDDPDRLLIQGRLVRPPLSSNQAWKKSRRSFSAVIIGLSDAQQRPLVYRGKSMNDDGAFTLRFTRQNTDRDLPMVSDAWRAAWPESQRPGDPVTLWFDAPTQTKSVDVPFVFEDIPVRQP